MSVQEQVSMPVIVFTMRSGTALGPSVLPAYLDTVQIMTDWHGAAFDQRRSQCCLQPWAQASDWNSRQPGGIAECRA